MLITKNQTREHKNSDSCTVWEYDLPSTQLSIATAQIDGRYPEAGSAVNSECEEIYFVLAGSGMIHTEKVDVSVTAGDVYYFERGESYWVEGSALSIALINSPKWRLEQYSIN